MYQTDKEKIKEVTKAVANLYSKIDDCVEYGSDFINRASENLKRDNYDTMDYIMSECSDTYELMENELVEEAVELIRALYWARKNADNFPMKNYGERSDKEKEYLSALNEEIKNLPLKA